MSTSAPAPVQTRGPAPGLLLGEPPGRARAAAVYAGLVALPALGAVLLLSALATDAIGIHPVFGAFLYGVVLPRRSAPLERAAGRLRAVAVPVLLPLFFASAGLHARFGLLGTDPRQWAWCGLIVLVAVLGKGCGGAWAARAVGAPRREALALGTLQNCRGVTELVVLAVGLRLGAISPTGYTMLVAMTVVSTAMTSPLLDRLGYGLRRGVSARPAAG